jgi:hypothetical protein
MADPPVAPRPGRHLAIFILKFLMQFAVDLPIEKIGAVSMAVMSRVRSSMDDPGKNRSYAKASHLAGQSSVGLSFQQPVETCSRRR